MIPKSKIQLKEIAETIICSKEKLEWCEKRFEQSNEFNDSRDIFELRNYIKMLLKNTPWRTAKEAEDYLKYDVNKF